MPSDIERLTEQARELADAAAGSAHGERAARLAGRLAARRFLVSVVGEFKRGKSTLINALVGEAVVPTGVLPLTAVATELSFGEPAAYVEHLDGRRITIDIAEIARYVTEAGNPNNELQVARVDVRGPWDRLRPGVVLVDTPGIGSVLAHNTAAARAALLDADGAVLVLSANAPLSEQERSLLQLLAERRAPTFIVMNRADDVTPSELDELRQFVGDAVRHELGHHERIYAVSARRAIEAVMGTAPGSAAFDFEDFAFDFDRFVSEELSHAMVATARAELARLGTSVQHDLAVEEAALRLDVDRLGAAVDTFRSEAERQRRAFADDIALLERDVAQLGEEVAAALSRASAAMPADAADRLEGIARDASRRDLMTQLRAEIESLVTACFETVRSQQLATVDDRWQQIAIAFADRVQARVDKLHAVASDLFAVALPPVAVPPVTTQREQFFYLFIRVGTLGVPVGDLARWLLPSSVVRQRAVVRASRELAIELDKHAGRARWDIVQRLGSARDAFVAEMRNELDAFIDGILAAAARAETLRSEAVSEQQQHAQMTARRARVAAAIAQLDAGDG